MYGRAVRDEREGGSAEACDLERRLEVASVRRDRPDDGSREREVAGPPPVRAAAHLVHPPHRLGVEADTGREPEAASVDPAERDAPRPARADGVGDLRGGPGEVVRQTERREEHARASARQEADRHVGVQPVQRLVEAAVAGEDDDRLAAPAAGVGHELGGVTGSLGSHRLDRRRRDSAPFSHRRDAARR